MTADEIIASLIAASGSAVASGWRSENEHWAPSGGGTESPIEQVFRVALCLCLSRTRAVFMQCPASFDPRRGLVLDEAMAAANKLGFTGFHQVCIGRYRVDFVLMSRSPSEEQNLVIECDGHDFHERTKEQAAADKSRDREIQMLGLRLLRFTGREIWADPWGCVDQAFELLNVIAEKRPVSR